MERLPADVALWTASPPDPARDSVREAVRAAVREALTDRQREAVELHFFHGLSQAEIARRLGVSQQVIHRRIHGSRRRGRVVGGALARLRTALTPALAARLSPAPVHAPHAPHAPSTQ